MSLLTPLLDIVFPPRDTELRVRGCTLASLSSHLEPHSTEGAQTLVTHLLPYREPLVQALILETKFHHSRRAISILGFVLQEYLESLAEEAAELRSAAFVLIPLPLSTRRKRSRGHNQVEEVCKAAASARPDVCTLATSLLTRVRDTAPQTTLKRAERLQNMQGAFEIASMCTLSPGATYIIVDDVVTTGATLADAVRALHQAGARDVLAIALAH